MASRPVVTWSKRAGSPRPSTSTPPPHLAVGAGAGQTAPRCVEGDATEAGPPRSAGVPRTPRRSHSTAPPPLRPRREACASSARADTTPVRWRQALAAAHKGGGAEASSRSGTAGTRHPGRTARLSRRSSHLRTCRPRATWDGPGRPPPARRLVALAWPRDGILPLRSVAAGGPRTAARAYGGGLQGCPAARPAAMRLAVLEWPRRCPAATRERRRPDGRRSRPAHATAAWSTPSSS